MKGTSWIYVQNLRIYTLLTRRKENRTSKGCCGWVIVHNFVTFGSFFKNNFLLFSLFSVKRSIPYQSEDWTGEVYWQIVSFYSRNLLENIFWVLLFNSDRNMPETTYRTTKARQIGYEKDKKELDISVGSDRAYVNRKLYEILLIFEKIEFTMNKKGANWLLM